MSENTRPGASFDVSYDTYENMKPVKLPQDLVTLFIENFLTVEVGGWGTLLKIIAKPGSDVSTSTKNGVTTVYFKPPQKVKTSILSQDDLTKNIGKMAKTLGV